MHTIEAAFALASALTLTVGMRVAVTLGGIPAGYGVVSAVAPRTDRVEGLLGEDLGPSEGVALIDGIDGEPLTLCVNPYTGVADAEEGTYVTPAVRA